jgi:hypothetical protein
MNRTTSHAVWNELNLLGPSIDSALKLTDNEPEAIDALERVRAVLTLAGRRLGATDPILAYPAALDGIATFLGETRAQVNQYTQTRDQTQLISANANF